MSYCSGAGKMLSNSLPFKEVAVSVGDTKIRLFARLNLPLPRFPVPNLELKIDSKFVLKEVTINLIEKKIPAPWIRRTRDTVQFTSKLEESKL